MQAQVDPNEDTEFNDALRAHGIIPPKAPSRSPSPEPPDASEVRSNRLKQATVEDIDDELELLKPNAEDADDEEKRLLALRRKRLEDLMKEHKRGRFGRVYPIARQDYSREVTEASKEDSNNDEGEQEMVSDENGGEKPARNGTGVVCFLYNDGLEECRLVSGFLDTLAAKYPTTKFVSIVGNKCIPNYPDKNLPTLLIYRNGDLHRQIVGLRREIGLDGLNTKLEDIELLLLAVGVIERSNVPGMQNYGGLQFKNDKENDEHDEQEEEFGGNRNKIKSSIRSQEEEDDDLDWDM